MCIHDMTRGCLHHNHMPCNQHWEQTLCLPDVRLLACTFMLGLRTGFRCFAEQKASAEINGLVQGRLVLTLLLILIIWAFIVDPTLLPVLLVMIVKRLTCSGKRLY